MSASFGTLAYWHECVRPARQSTSPVSMLTIVNPRGCAAVNKAIGRLQVVAFDVERMATSPQDEQTDQEEGDSTSEGEIVAPGDASNVAPA